MVGDVREMAVVSDEGMVDVAVPVEKGRLAESAVESRESGCHSSMPTMHNTLFFPSLFMLTFGKTLTRHERFMLRLGNLSAIIECTTDNCTDSSEFPWN